MFGLFARKGPFKTRVSSTGQEFTVPPNETVLKAALAAGIPWPNSCRVGSCGTCRCRLVSGKIKALNDFSYVLNESEMEEGYILACQTALRGDVEIDVKLVEASAAAASASINGTIEHLRDLTHDIREVRIRLSDKLDSYLPGQFAELVPKSVAMDRPRSYSFASALSREERDCVTFHIRLVPGGSMTTWLHKQAVVGDAVTVKGPFGNFYLRETSSPIICIAGGSGMAPIKALLEGLVDSKTSRRVFFLYGARTQKDLYCLEEMDSISRASIETFTFLPILSNEPEGSDWAGERGFVTEFIKRIDIDFKKAEAYLCGPPPMIDAAIAQLKLLGMNDKNVFFDKFLDASHLQKSVRDAA